MHTGLAFWHAVFDGGSNQRGTFGIFYLFLISVLLHTVFCLLDCRRALGRAFAPANSWDYSTRKVDVIPEGGVINKSRKISVSSILRGGGHVMVNPNIQTIGQGSHCQQVWTANSTPYKGPGAWARAHLISSLLWVFLVS